MKIAAVLMREKAGVDLPQNPVDKKEAAMHRQGLILVLVEMTITSRDIQEEEASLAILIRIERGV